jgi:hypothetical protein
MKYFLPLTILTVAVAGGLFLDVNAHHDYIHQLTIQNAHTAAVRAKAVLKTQAQAQSTAKKLQVANTDIVLLVAQCKEGQAAYNLLTPSQKPHAKEPYCSYNTVQ